MKHSLFKRVFAFLISLVMLFSACFTAYAFDDFGSFSGHFVTNSAISLSNIEIKVYSALPIYGDNGLMYYAETYAHSVYSDEFGHFTFEKPSQFCSISIELESLPVNCGVSKQTQFIIPSDVSIEIEISTVHEVRVEMCNGNLNPTIYNSSHNQIFASCTIIPSAGNIISSSKNTELSLDSINSISSYNHNGVVKVGTKTYSYLVEEKITNYSMIEKIDYLTTVGYINESERIHLLCDLLKSTNYSLESGTLIYGQIIDYATSHNLDDTNISSSLRSLASTRSTSPSYSTFVSATIGSQELRVFYDEAKEMTAEVANNILTEFVYVYNYFVTDNNFTAPLPYDNTPYYALYLVGNDYTTANGLTEPQSNRSRIILNYSVATGGLINYKRTISHEFCHAIMFAYGITSASTHIWFHESFASMSALIYCGQTQSWFDYVISDYLTHSYKSIYSTDSLYHIYGALVYPLYIHTYLGGWATIETIYSNYTTQANGFSAISSALTNNSYRSAFLESASRNYKPQAYYAYATTDWGTGSINDFSIPFESSTNMTIQSVACHYQRFSSSSDIGTTYFTIEITSDNGTGMMINKITETGNGAPVISRVTDSFSRITVQQTNFGGNIKKLTFVIANTLGYGSSISYKISAST